MADDQPSAKPKLQVRRKALQALRGNEDTEQPLVVDRPRGWLALAALALLLAALLAFGLLGELPRSVDAQGVIEPAGGLAEVQSTVAGQVIDVNVTRDSTVEQGQTVFVVRDGDGERHEIVSPFGGTVDSVQTQPGRVVAPGTSLFTVRRSGPDGELTGFAFLREDQASSVVVGQDAHLLPSASDAYGAMTGRVAAIDTAPATRSELEDILSDDAAVDDLLRDGRPVIVRVELDRASTPSGLNWEQDDGPAHALSPGTPVAVEISQGDEHPIETLFGG